MISPPDCTATPQEMVTGTPLYKRTVVVGKAQRAHQRLQKKKGGHGASAPLPTLRSCSQWRRKGCNKSPLHLQLLRRLRCEIGQDAVGAGALEPQEAFHHRPLAVDPAVGAGRCDP